MSFIKTPKAHHKKKKKVFEQRLSVLFNVYNFVLYMCYHILGILFAFLKSKQKTSS